MECGFDGGALVLLGVVVWFGVVDVGCCLFGFDIGFGAFGFLGGGGEEEAGFDGGAGEGPGARG